MWEYYHVSEDDDREYVLKDQDMERVSMQRKLLIQNVKHRATKREIPGVYDELDKDLSTPIESGSHDQHAKKNNINCSIGKRILITSPFMLIFIEAVAKVFAFAF